MQLYYLQLSIYISMFYCYIIDYTIHSILITQFFICFVALLAIELYMYTLNYYINNKLYIILNYY